MINIMELSENEIAYFNLKYMDEVYTRYHFTDVTDCVDAIVSSEGLNLEEYDPKVDYPHMLNLVTHELSRLKTASNNLGDDSTANQLRDGYDYTNKYLFVKNRINYLKENNEEMSMEEWNGSFGLK